MMEKIWKRCIKYENKDDKMTDIKIMEGMRANRTI